MDYIFFDYHCDLSQKFTNDRKKIKSLDVLSKNLNVNKITLENSVIIDDNIYVYDNQPENCIRIKAFDVIKNKNPDTDKQLKKIKLRFELMIV